LWHSRVQMGAQGDVRPYTTNGFITKVHCGIQAIRMREC
jgi:hypothetical protein